MSNVKSSRFLIIPLICFFIFIILLNNKNVFAFDFKTSTAGIEARCIENLKEEASRHGIIIVKETIKRTQTARGNELFFFETAVEFKNFSALFGFFDSLFENSIINPYEIETIQSEMLKTKSGLYSGSFSFYKLRSEPAFAHGCPAHYQILKDAVRAASKSFNIKINKFYYLRYNRISIKASSHYMNGLMAYVDFFSENNRIERFSDITIEKKHYKYYNSALFVLDFTAALR
ncbi:MAG: hypothetical protein BWY32_01256 [bacterium ADurb.Bin243]|nr:MAG: hypothetical protein BWY32_01256 [bacterium ADurb.Bin243]